MQIPHQAFDAPMDLLGEHEGKQRSSQTIRHSKRGYKPTASPGLPRTASEPRLAQKLPNSVWIWCADLCIPFRPIYWKVFHWN